MRLSKEQLVFNVAGAEIGPTDKDFEKELAFRQRKLAALQAERKQMDANKIAFIAHENSITEAKERFANIRARAEKQSLERQAADIEAFANTVGSTFSSMFGDVLGGIEALAAGQEVNFAKMAAGWIKMVGQQMLASGIGVMAAAAGQLALSKGTIGWVPMAQGAAMAAAGGAMAATGAIAGGLATRTGFGSVGGGTADSLTAGIGSSSSQTPGISSPRSSRDRQSTGTGVTYVFQAPVYGDQTKTAKETHRLQRLARRQFLLPE